MYRNKSIACVIPARMSSSRFPGKPLVKIHGREMVLRVADIAKKCKYFDRIIIATEDSEIREVGEIAGYEAWMTGKHYTCTHRVAEVANNLMNIDYVFNLQGDEPLAIPESIDATVEYGIDNDYDMVQPARKLLEGEMEDPDVVKMVINNGLVLHMQREPDVICDNLIAQVGLYFYRMNVIRDYPNCDMTYVKYWNGLDTIAFCGRHQVIPFDLECSKLTAVDRPHHIQAVEQYLMEMSE